MKCKCYCGHNEILIRTNESFSEIQENNVNIDNNWNYLVKAVFTQCCFFVWPLKTGADVALIAAW